jgi:hypothetical protein
LECSLVCACGIRRIGVGRIKRANFTAVGAVQSIQEVVEETLVSVIGFIHWVIGLKQNAILRIDQGI